MIKNQTAVIKGAMIREVYNPNKLKFNASFQNLKRKEKEFMRTSASVPTLP